MSAPAICLFALFALLSAAYATDAGAEPRRRVFVYYANETSLTAARSDNYRRLLAALRESDSSVGEQLASTIEADVQSFRSVVQKDEIDLMQAARQIGFDLVIFTNARTLDGHFLQLDRDAGEVRTRQFTALSRPENAVLATSPLSRPDAFHAALAAVPALFPDEALDIVLTTASHGSADMAIIPRVSTNLSSPDARKEFLHQLAGSHESGAPSPEWAKLQGISKSEYWKILADVSAGWNARFPLVFRQSCASGLHSWSELRSLPESVDKVAHSGMRNMNIRQIDYSAVLASPEPGRDWLEAFKTRIQMRQVSVENRQTIWIGVAMIHAASINPIVYCIPLLAWLGWVVMVVLKQRRVALVD